MHSNFARNTSFLLRCGACIECICKSSSPQCSPCEILHQLYEILRRTSGAAAGEEGIRKENATTFAEFVHRGAAQSTSPYHVRNETPNCYLLGSLYMACFLHSSKFPLQSGTLVVHSFLLRKGVSKNLTTNFPLENTETNKLI